MDAPAHRLFAIPWQFQISSDHILRGLSRLSCTLRREIRMLPSVAACRISGAPVGIAPVSNAASRETATSVAMAPAVLLSRPFLCARPAERSVRCRTDYLILQPAEVQRMQHRKRPVVAAFTSVAALQYGPEYPVRPEVRRLVDPPRDRGFSVSDTVQIVVFTNGIAG